MTPALGVILVVGIVIAAVVASRKQQQRLQQTFSWLGDQLGGGCSLSERTAWGTLANADVRYAFIVKGAGKHAQYWTHIEADIPPPYPLRLFVRKHGWLDHGKIERGEMVDVIVGDPAFDQRFLVEAAPADIARLLLDARERAYLLALSDKLWFEITTEGARLRLAIRTWVYDLPEAMRGLEAVAAIAGRLRDAYATVEQAAAPREVGTPFRPMLDDVAAREAADARLQEVARVDAARTRRAAHEQLVAVAVVAAFVVLAIVALVTAR